MMVRWWGGGEVTVGNQSAGYPHIMDAIDFRELRRQERQRIRLQSTAGCHSVSNDDGDEDAGTNIKDDGVIAASTSLINDPGVKPYTSLLPRGRIFDELYRVAGYQSMINSVYYAQHFLSSKQEKKVMEWLSSIPEYTQSGYKNNIAKEEREESIQHNGKWTRLHHAKRKVALFDDTVCNLPHILQRLSNTLVDVGAFPSTHPPNHVLINEYQPGEGIIPHTDGPAYDSRTATISLGGSDVIFKLWPRTKPDNNDDIQIALEVILHGHGSLVLFTDDAYMNHCHEISEGVLEERLSSDGTWVKRGYRISMTFRHKK
jgi:alkylated DNA repair dioxygenase AlkB